MLPPDAIRARVSGTGALPAAAAMEPEPEHAGEMVAAEGPLARVLGVRDTDRALRVPRVGVSCSWYRM